MTVQVGWTYKFTFLNDFSSLDGVYSVVKIYSYNEIIDDGVDLNEGLYAKVNKTPDMLDTDIGLYRNEPIYKLVDPDNSENIIYTPSPILLNEPDPNIKKYAKLVIGINAGVCEDIAQLDYVKATVHELLEKMVGLTEQPQVFSIGSSWLTADEYADIVAQRNTTSREVVNYFSETQKLLNIIAEQNTAIATLKSHITNITQCYCNQPPE